MPTGVASVIVSFFLSMYYNVINAWAFWYLFHSFQVCGHLVAQLSPTMAAEGHSGFALVLVIAQHCRQLGGDQKLQKSTQGFSGGKNEAVVSLSGGSLRTSGCLLLSTKRRSRPVP